MPIGWGPVSVNFPGVPDLGDVGGLFGKRKRSSCRHVDPKDVGCFRGGTCAPWIVGERLADIATVYGVPFTGTDNPSAEALGLIFSDVADVHMDQFVPLCDKIEGGEAGYTKDPNAGQGLAVYNAAREAFKDEIRAGRVKWKHAPRGGRGGELPPGSGVTPQPQPGQTSGLALVGVVAALLLAS